MKTFLVLAACLAGTACVSIRPVAAPADFIAKQQPQLVWVTAQSGEVIPVSRPTLSGDTLRGQWLGMPERVAFALPQVKLVQARQRDRTRTTLLLATGAAVAGILVWHAIKAGDGPSLCIYEPGQGTQCQ